ncbi:hypothetical protein Tco_0477984 [Tanacetum coccineum]
MHTVRGDGVTGIKRCRRDLSSNGIRNFATASGRGDLIRECIARKDVRVIDTRSKDQVADIFTKSLNERDFTRQRMMLGVEKSSLKGGVGS